MFERLGARLRRVPSAARVTLGSFAVTLVLLLGGATGTGVAHAASVTLRASSTTVTSPDSYTLMASATDDTQEFIEIVDDDSGRTLTTCLTLNGDCGTTVYPGWDETNRARTAHFHARILNNQLTEIATSDPVTVDVLPYPLEVTLTPSPDSVTMPNSFTLTANAKPTTWAPYWVAIIDDGTGQTLTNCNPGYGCGTTVYPGWSQDGKSHTGHYHAEILSLDSQHTLARSDDVEVQERMPDFGLRLLASAHVLDNGVGLDLTATVKTGWAPYFLNIMDADADRQLSGCFVGYSCGDREYYGQGTHHLYAVIETFSGQEIVRSRVVTVDVTAAGDTIDGVDIAKLAGMIGSTEELCLDLAAVPGAPNTNGSSANDFAKACLLAQADGKSVKEILTAIAKMGGGGGAIGFVIFVATPQDTDDGNPPGPPPPPPGPPKPPAPPETVPQVWDGPVAQAAQDILTLNPALDLTEEQADQISKRCNWLLAESGIPLSRCHEKGLPIFLSGSTTPESTQHDLDAIVGKQGVLDPHPEWVLLGYVNDTEQVGPRGWYRSSPECAGSSRPDKLDCDEFPYFSTNRGGRDAVPTPSLRVLPSGDNRSQGSTLGNGYTKCGMQSAPPPLGGDPFIVLPIPDGPPTMMICNQGS